MYSEERFVNVGLSESNLEISMELLIDPVCSVHVDLVYGDFVLYLFDITELIRDMNKENFQI